MNPIISDANDWQFDTLSQISEPRASVQNWFPCILYMNVVVGNEIPTITTTIPYSKQAVIAINAPIENLWADETPTKNACAHCMHTCIIPDIVFLQNADISLVPDVCMNTEFGMAYWQIAVTQKCVSSGVVAVLRQAFEIKAWSYNRTVVLEKEAPSGETSHNIMTFYWCVRCEDLQRQPLWILQRR